MQLLIVEAICSRKKQRLALRSKNAINHGCQANGQLAVLIKSVLTTCRWAIEMMESVNSVLFVCACVRVYVYACVLSSQDDSPLLLLSLVRGLFGLLSRCACVHVVGSSRMLGECKYASCLTATNFLSLSLLSQKTPRSIVTFPNPWGP